MFVGGLFHLITSPHPSLHSVFSLNKQCEDASTTESEREVSHSSLPLTLARSECKRNLCLVSGSESCSE